MKKVPAGAKNLLKTVVFLLILFAMLFKLSYVLRPYSGSATRKNICGFYAEEENSHEVVFIGSSAVFAFWQPMKFWNDYGVPSYNFAAGSMPPQMIKYCIEEVRKTQNPKLFVIDLRPFGVAENGYYLEKEIKNMDHEAPIRTTIDNFKYSLTRLKMIKNGVPSSQGKLSYVFDLIKYHSEWPRLIDEKSWSYGTNEKHDYTKGFNMVNRVRRIAINDYSDITAEQELSKRLNRIFINLLEYCKEEDLQVQFLISTYKQPKKSKRKYNYMARVIEEYGFDCLNTNDHIQEIGLDFDTDFYDKNHVNIFGSDKYTDYVANYLMERYELEDKRGQEAYASWDEDYELWSKSIANLKASITKKIAERDARDAQKAQEEAAAAQADGEAANETQAAEAETAQTDGEAASETPMTETETGQIEET